MNINMYIPGLKNVIIDHLEEQKQRIVLYISGSPLSLGVDFRSC
ncbi:hypothetical protein [Solibacillus sp. CAU 1738]